MTDQELLHELGERLEQAKEQTFLDQYDLKKAVTENIALKTFVQNIYESCDQVDQSELSMEGLIKNLKENIRVFAKDHKIKL